MHVLMKGTGRLSAGRAVKQAKRLGDGGEIALTGGFRGSASAVTMLEPGQIGEWLAGLDGTVLYIHDDVHVDSAQMEELRVLQAHGQALVAPRVEVAESRPADIPAVLGSSASIADFLGCIAGGRPAPNIERVASVHVDHAMTCQNDLGRPLLVASMIVRDEADQIGACLASLSSLVDRVEIVDTGSGDDTIAIAEALGASVTTAAWTDDFGAARNVALDRCRDARFVLHIDADERLVVPDPPAVRSALEATTARALKILMRNLVDDRVTSEFEAVRVFSTERTQWVGRVHEYPADVDGSPLAAEPVDGVGIDHLGYDPEIVVAKGKWDRNVTLAEAAYRAEPSFKTRLDLARSLAWRSDEQRAFALFKEAADDLTGASPGAAAFVLGHVALAHQIEGDLDRAHQLATEAIGHCSGEYVAHLARARAWRDAGDDQAIANAHAWRTSSALAPPMFDTAASRSMVDNLVSGALVRLGRHVDAIELAVSVLDTDPARFDEWKSFAALPQPLREPGLKLMATLDRTGSFAGALVGEVSMQELAGLVLAHVEGGRPAADAVVTGIMAAVLTGDEETAAAIAAAGAHALDDEQRLATAERCRLRDATVVAGLLEPTSV